MPPIADSDVSDQLPRSRTRRVGMGIRAGKGVGIPMHGDHGLGGVVMLEIEVVNYRLSTQFLLRARAIVHQYSW
jgi:hypothetical protein